MHKLLSLSMMVGMLACGNLFAQHQHTHRCYTTQKIEEARKNDPTIAQRRAAIEARIQKHIQKEEVRLRTHGQRMGTVYTIPVVFHVLYRTNAGNVSDARIQEQLDVLNDDYRRTNADASQTPAVFAAVAADMEIDFCMATVDPSGSPTTGITRKQVSTSNIGQGSAYYSTAQGGQTIWDPSRYLNIWVCEIGGGILGYTYTPGNAPNGADGVVIDYNYFGITGASAPYNGGRTLTHEVGHWLNLEHIWGPGSGGCNSDDFVNDTPMQNSQYGGCPSHPQSSCSSNDMFMNYMDYVQDNCMNMFSQGQKTRMRAAITASRPNLVTGQRCAIPADDVGISSINTPSGNLCTTSFTPELVLRNYGTNTLTSVSINYQIDAAAVQTYAWTGALTSGQSITITLGTQTTTTGSHTFTAYTSTPNGTVDQNTGNDQAQVSFTVSAAQSLPFTEGFESTNFLSNGWTIYNGDNDVTWARTTIAAKTGSASLFMDNWDYAANGQSDYITTPALDFSNALAPELEFDLAYALYSTTGYSDTLRIWASDDCEQTWNLVYDKAGTNLTTVSSLVTTEFIPGANDWRLETVDLSAFAGKPNVSLLFHHVNDYENNLYIDNVNVSSVLSSANPSKKEAASCRVYPNPSKGVFTLDVNFGKRAEDVQLVVYDLMGREQLRMEDQGVDKTQYQMDLSHLAKGMYSVIVSGGGEQMIQKIIIQ